MVEVKSTWVQHVTNWFSYMTAWENYSNSSHHSTTIFTLCPMLLKIQQIHCLVKQRCCETYLKQSGLWYTQLIEKRKTFITARLRKICRLINCHQNSITSYPHLLAYVFSYIWVVPSQFLMYTQAQLNEAMWD